MNTILKNKKILIALGIVAVILVVFLVMLFTVKPRVVGVWQGEITYLEKYGCNTILTIEFESDGEATKVWRNAKAGSILNVKSGYWKVSGFEASFREPGEIGEVVYDFNVITGTLKNVDNTYKKIN